jgi:hypothetical protein
MVNDQEGQTEGLHGMSDIKQYIAQKAESLVSGARRKGYGAPGINFHRIALMWQAWLDARGLRIVDINQLEDGDEDWREYRLTEHDISPMMRIMKEARLIETPAHLDSLLDMVGYTLTGAEVSGVQIPNDTPLTREEMNETKLRFGDLLAEKNKRIVELEKQLAMMLRDPRETTAELTTASAGQGGTSSQAQQTELGN